MTGAEMAKQMKNIGCYKIREGGNHEIFFRHGDSICDVTSLSVTGIKVRKINKVPISLWCKDRRRDGKTNEKYWMLQNP